MNQLAKPRTLGFQGLLVITDQQIDLLALQHVREQNLRLIPRALNPLLRQEVGGPGEKCLDRPDHRRLQRGIGHESVPWSARSASRRTWSLFRSLQTLFLVVLTE